MNCAEIRLLLHAHADGELDLVRSLELEQHLRACAACAAEKKSLQSLRARLRDSDLAFHAPESLRQKVRQIARGSGNESQPREHDLTWLWKWLAAGATAFAVLAILLRPAGFSENDQLLNEAMAGHVRSLMAGHLTDVESSDQHTVKPWFTGKLDFSPQVKDFAAQGFPLVGGRLDYLQGRTVAALVYRHNKHLINVFIWPATADGRTNGDVVNYRGYSIVNRDRGGFHYCLVSDVEETELNQLAGLLGN